MQAPQQRPPNGATAPSNALAAADKLKQLIATGPSDTQQQHRKSGEEDQTEFVPVTSTRRQRNLPTGSTTAPGNAMTTETLEPTAHQHQRQFQRGGTQRKPQHNNFNNREHQHNEHGPQRHHNHHHHHHRQHGDNSGHHHHHQQQHLSPSQLALLLDSEGRLRPEFKIKVPAEFDDSTIQSIPPVSSGGVLESTRIVYPISTLIALKKSTLCPQSPAQFEDGLLVEQNLLLLYGCVQGVRGSVASLSGGTGAVSSSSGKSRRKFAQEDGGEDRNNEMRSGDAFSGEPAVDNDGGFFGSGIGGGHPPKDFDMEKFKREMRRRDGLLEEAEEDADVHKGGNNNSGDSGKDKQQQLLINDALNSAQPPELMLQSSATASGTGASKSGSGRSRFGGRFFNLDDEDEQPQPQQAAAVTAQATKQQTTTDEYLARLMQAMPQLATPQQPSSLAAPSAAAETKPFSPANLHPETSLTSPPPPSSTLQNKRNSINVPTSVLLKYGSPHRPSVVTGNYEKQQKSPDPPAHSPVAGSKHSSSPRPASASPIQQQATLSTAAATPVVGGAVDPRLVKSEHALPSNFMQHMQPPQHFMPGAMPPFPVAPSQTALFAAPPSSAVDPALLPKSTGSQSPADLTPFLMPDGSLPPPHLLPAPVLAELLMRLQSNGAVPPPPLPPPLPLVGDKQQLPPFLFPPGGAAPPNPMDFPMPMPPPPEILRLMQSSAGAPPALINPQPDNGNNNPLAKWFPMIPAATPPIQTAAVPAVASKPGKVMTLQEVELQQASFRRN